MNQISVLNNPKGLHLCYHNSQVHSALLEFYSWGEYICLKIICILQEYFKLYANYQY